LTAKLHFALSQILTFRFTECFIGDRVPNNFGQRFGALRGSGFLALNLNRSTNVQTYEKVSNEALRQLSCKTLVIGIPLFPLSLSVVFCGVCGALDW